MNELLRRLSTIFIFYSFKQFKIIKKGSFITGLLLNDYIKQVMQDLFAFTRPKLSIFFEKLYVSSRSLRF